MITSAVRSVWNYRAFVLGSVAREFQSKYRNSLLGAAWTIISPLSMILVYTVVFSQVMRARLPGMDSSFAYGIYLCAGILTWGFFCEITGRAQNTFLENANLIKKLSFPRLCLPTAIVINAALNFAIIFGLFTIFLVITGNFPGVAFLSVLPSLGILAAFAVGLGLTLGVVNVFFRDVGHFFGIFLQFWFWLTPIVYPISILPPQVQDIVEYNPMTPLMLSFQSTLVFGSTPEWVTLFYPALLAFLLCVLALRLFRKHGGDMVDEL